MSPTEDLLNSQRRNAVSARCGSSFRPEPGQGGEHSRRDDGLARQEALDRHAGDGLRREPGQQAGALGTIAHVVGEEAGVDGARYQHRHGDAPCGHLAGDRAAQGDEIGFGGCIDGKVRHRRHAGERGDVEHAAPTARHHARQEGAHQRRCGLDVEGQRSTDVIGSVAREGAGRPDARTVDENVDRAARRPELGCQPRRCPRPSEIAGEMRDSDAVCFFQARGGPAQALGVARDQHDLMPAGGETTGQREADAARAAGDQHDRPRYRFRSAQHAGLAGHLVLDCQAPASRCRAPPARGSVRWRASRRQPHASRGGGQLARRRGALHAFDGLVSFAATGGRAAIAAAHALEALTHDQIRARHRRR